MHLLSTSCHHVPCQKMTHSSWILHNELVLHLLSNDIERFLTRRKLSGIKSLEMRYEISLQSKHCCIARNETHSTLPLPPRSIKIIEVLRGVYECLNEAKVSPTWKNLVGLTHSRGKYIEKAFCWSSWGIFFSNNSVRCWCSFVMHRCIAKLFW